MTEKSEDQVIWVCIQHQRITDSLEDQLCEKIDYPKAYVPLSKYLALKSDLAVAVEALKSIFGDGSYTNYAAGDMFREIAQEALGKIGGGPQEKE